MKLFSAKKVLRTLSILGLGFTLTQTALSSGDVKFNPVSDEGKVMVSLQDVQANKVSLSIEDIEESTVYYSANVSNAEGYKKVFDLSNLADGTYVLVAKYGKNTIKREFVVENSTVVLSEAENIFECRPVFRQTDEGLVVLYQCPTMENVEVSFSADYNRFFIDKTNETKIARKYDVTELPAGEYDVVLKAGEYSYTYSLNIQ